MADRTMLAKLLCSAMWVGCALNWGQFRITLTGKLFPRGRPFGQPIKIAFQICDQLAVTGRHMAVHAVAETFLDTQGHGVDLAVLGAELRIERPSRPHRCRASLSAMVQMAVGAIQAIADIVAC